MRLPNDPARGKTPRRQPRFNTMEASLSPCNCCLISRDRGHYVFVDFRKAFDLVGPQVAQTRNISIGEHWHCCVTFKHKDLYGKNLSFL